MTSSLHPSVPVTDDAALTARWRGLLDLGGPPSRRSLVLAWLRRDGTMAPLLIPVDDVPVEPDRVALGHLVEMHAAVAEAEHVEPAELHLALCLERRGPAGLGPDDHAWATAVEAILRGRDGLDCSLHIADGRDCVPVLPRAAWPVS